MKNEKENLFLMNGKIFEKLLGNVEFLFIHLVTIQCLILLIMMTIYISSVLKIGLDCSRRPPSWQIVYEQNNFFKSIFFKKLVYATRHFSNAT